MPGVDFTGKTVLVVGGSSGIGNGIAHGFRARGASVTVTGTRPDFGDYLEAEDSDFTGLEYRQLDLTDRDAEIVADRGLNGRITPDEWEAICGELERTVPGQGLEAAVVHAVAGIGSLLRKAFPADVESNELPDEPVLR